MNNLEHWTEVTRGLFERPVFECLEAAIKDDKENNQ